MTDGGTGRHGLAFPSLRREESKAESPREEALVSGRSVLSLLREGLVTDGLPVKAMPKKGMDESFSAGRY